MVLAGLAGRGGPRGGRLGPGEPRRPPPPGHGDFAVFASLAGRVFFVFIVFSSVGREGLFFQLFFQSGPGFFFLSSFFLPNLSHDFFWCVVFGSLGRELLLSLFYPVWAGCLCCRCFFQFGPGEVLPNKALLKKHANRQTNKKIKQ